MLGRARDAPKRAHARNIFQTVHNLGVGKKMKVAWNGPMHSGIFNGGMKTFLTHLTITSLPMVRFFKFQMLNNLKFNCLFNSIISSAICAGNLRVNEILTWEISWKLTEITNVCILSHCAVGENIFTQFSQILIFLGKVRVPTWELLLYHSLTVWSTTWGHLTPTIPETPSKCCPALPLPPSDLADHHPHNPLHNPLMLFLPGHGWTLQHSWDDLVQGCFFVELPFSAVHRIWYSTKVENLFPR